MPTLVAEVMSTPARTVPPTAGRRAIVEMLAQNHIGAVPVVDESNRVVGIVSESDLMPSTPAEQMAQGAGLAGGHGWGPDQGESRADAIMHAPAVTIEAGTRSPKPAGACARRRFTTSPWWMPKTGRSAC